MKIHIINADFQGFSFSDISSADISNTTESSCKSNIFSVEKAMKNAVDSSKPDLLIINNVLQENTQQSFREIFAGIIYRAEKKIQEKPWIEVKKQLKKQNSIFNKKTKSQDNKISRDVPYCKKKTHVCAVNTEGKTAYTFAYSGTQALVLPYGITLQQFETLVKEAVKAFKNMQKDYPEGYTVTEKTHHILTFKEKYIPSKNDTNAERSRKTVRAFAFCVFLVAGILFLNKTIFMPLGNSISAIEYQQIVTGGEETKDGKKIIKKEDWKKLKKINKDIIGCIKIDNTRIDYPILQCKKDSSKSQYYLYHNYKGDSSSYGSIFVDYRSKKGLKSKNIVLHGHSMNDGSMFGNLLKYGTTSIDMKFYKKAPVINISSPEKGTETYKIFSIFKSNVNPAQGEYFDFYCGEFSSNSQFMNYVYNLKIRSLVDTGVTINEKDQILTLVTCSYEFKNFRTVVVARKCRDGETTQVDTSVAKQQKDPLWPQIYYTYRGGRRPDVSTFKTEYEKGTLTWYDGEGKLNGEEILPTSIELPTISTETVAKTTKKTSTKKPSATEKVKVYYTVQIYNGDALHRIMQVESGKKVQMPKIAKTYEEGGYKYTFDRWKIKGSKSYEKITCNTVITAVYKKSKITTSESTTATTKPTQGTEPTTNPPETTSATEVVSTPENQEENVE